MEPCILQVEDVDEWIHGRRDQLHRTRDEELRFEVPAGGYAYRFVAGDPERGLSIEASEVELDDHH